METKLLPYGFNGLAQLNKFYSQDSLSIFRKTKPVAKKEIPERVIRLVDELILEGQRQRAQRLENKIQR